MKTDAIKGLSGMGYLAPKAVLVQLEAETAILYSSLKATMEGDGSGKSGNEILSDGGYFKL